MGKIINNPITSTFSGSLGEDVVFRRVGSRTFFVKKPVIRKPATPAQQENRSLFAMAQLHASVSLENPEMSEWYAIVAKVNNLKSASRAAANDYMTKPEIESINTKSYTGNLGDTIHFKPKTFLKITRIEVSIYDINGVLLESGPGIKNGLLFKYCATTFNPQVEGSKIEVITHDRLKRSCKYCEYLTQFALTGGLK